MSLRAAINAKCKDCIYDSCSPGTWRAQVASCSAPACPLWPYRPAPTVGLLAHPPRDPSTVTREWLTKSHSEVILGHPQEATP